VLEGNSHDPPGQTVPNTLMLELEGAVPLVDARQFREAAKACLEGSADVSVNCLTLEYLDTAVLQVLLALRRELQGSGRTLRLYAVPDQSVRLFALAGFTMVTDAQKDRR
jgi:anti-anti-sigma factor